MNQKQRIVLITNIMMKKEYPKKLTDKDRKAISKALAEEVMFNLKRKNK